MKQMQRLLALLFILTLGKTVVSSENFIPESDSIRRVFSFVNNNYVDLERAEPHKMLLKSLDNLSYKIPSFTYDILTEDTLVFSVKNEKFTFHLSELNNIEELAFLLEDITYTVKEITQKTEDFDSIDQLVIQGSLESLDPYSALLIPDVYVSFSQENQGEYFGVGMVISNRDDKTVIVKIYPESPALKGGARAHDVILKVDDANIYGWSTEDVSKKLRGDEGTQVKLLLEREINEQKEIVETMLTRERIELKSIHYDSVTQNKKRIGYIKIEQFTANTSKELTNAIDDLNIDFNDFSGIILDLRDNPGGLLSQAIRISDKFLTEGDIVYVATINDEIKSHHIARPYNTIHDIPMVVLINRNSASASEIVSAALKKNNRAIIIGQKTFGKGSVQTIIPLSNGSGVKLTDAKYLTPDKISIQSLGIHPHITTSPLSVSADSFSTFDKELYYQTKNKDDAFSEWGNVKDTQIFHLRYLKNKKTDKTLQITEDKKFNFESDFEFNLARKILLNDRSSDKFPALLENAVSVAKKQDVEERRKIIDALKKSNITWGEDPLSEVVDKVTISTEIISGTSTNTVKKKFSSGENVIIRLTIENESDSEISQPYITFESSSYLLNRKQAVTSKIPPKSSIVIDFPVLIPEQQSKSAIKFSVILTNTNEIIFAETSDYFLISKKQSPQLSYSINSHFINKENQPIDSLTAQDKIELTITFKNLSKVDSGDIKATLKNADPDSLELLSVAGTPTKLGYNKSMVYKYVMRLKQLPPDNKLDFFLSFSDSLFPNNNISTAFQLPIDNNLDEVKNMPPEISLISENFTDDNILALAFKVRDDKTWKEVYGFLNDRKIYYNQNTKGTTSGVFNVSLDLKPNEVNYVSFFAIDSDNVRISKRMSFFPQK